MKTRPFPLSRFSPLPVATSVALALVLGVLSGVAHGSPMTPSQVEAWLQKSSALPPREKAIEASALLLGTPYASDPLGEGSEGVYDQDPRVRFDAFDCTTFVETVLALSKAPDWSAFTRLLDEIRYGDGRVGYLERNHFTSLDWIPNNARAGHVNELTRRIAERGNRSVQVATALIDKPRWYAMKRESQLRLTSPLAPEGRRALLERWHAEGRAFRPEETSLDYLPFEEFLKTGEPRLVDLLPPVAILNLVRPNWDLTGSIGTHLNVSHQLLFIRSPDGQARVRHADSASRQVTEVSFEAWVRSYLNHPTAKGLSVLGLD